jgi:hypothetical protein
MTNHTPKPQWIAEWPIVDGNRCGHPFVSERGERFIATMDFDSPEAFDCAHLIAAAPDMLAILEELLPELQCRCHLAFTSRGKHDPKTLCHHADAVKSAIAKARGQG